MKLLLKLVIASVLFLGILPALLFWKENMIFIGVVFILSLACYGSVELVSASKKDKKKKAELCSLSNALFTATLFFALAGITMLYLKTSWAQTLQVGFLSLSAAYYSFTFLQFAFLGRTA